MAGKRGVAMATALAGARAAVAFAWAVAWAQGISVGTAAAATPAAATGGAGAEGAPRAEGAPSAPSPADLRAASRCYRRSYQAESTRNYRAALAALERLPASLRGTYLFHLRRGWLRYLTGDHRGAVRAYREAVRQAPGALEPLLGLTLPQMALRRWRDVVATSTRILGRDPMSYVARSRLAFAAYQLGRFAESRRLYQALLRDYPSETDLRAGLGWCLLKLRRASAAASAFREVLAVAPGHASARAGVRLAQR